MSVYSGPEIPNSGLVFLYDMANTQKSWKGMPTTNLLPQPLSFQTGYTLESWTGELEDNTTRTTAPDGTYTATRIKRTTGYIYKRNTTSPTFTISPGQTVTFSCWIRKLDDTSQAGLGIYIWCYNGAGSGNRALASQPVYRDSWVLQSVTYTALTGETDFSFGFCGAHSFTSEIAIWHPQVEISTIATPFVNGTRSNTQAILDLTNNNTITATSLTYASDGTFSFNGTSNRLNLGDPASGLLDFGTNSFTLEAWFKLAYLPNAWTGIIHKGSSGTQGYAMDINPSNYLTASIQGISGSNQHSAGYLLSANTWYHAVIVFNRVVNMQFYINGNLVSTASYATGNDSSVDTGAALFIGAATDTPQWTFPGSITKTAIYNRALSATEVQQNFEAVRGIYGL